MNKNELLKASVYIFIGVIIALGIFMLSEIGEDKNRKPQNENINSTSTSRIRGSIWDDLTLSEAKEVIGKNFTEIKTEQGDNMSIYKKADITGDGIEEALIYLGSGGAYTSYFALVQGEILENDQIKINKAKFKTSEGRIEDVMFVEGTSVSHGMSVEFAPSKNAIYAESWQIDPINPDTIECNIEAYVWNQNSKIFEYNEKVGKDATESYCSKIFVN